jgi:hypothetical protein
MGHDNRIKELEEKIVRLEEELQHARTHTYVGETETLYCNDGELYIYYDNDEKTLVMDIDQLYKDLPSIIRMVTKEQKKMQEMHLEMIKEALS